MADGERCRRRRRLDDPSDFVRLEIEAALCGDIPVIESCRQCFAAENGSICPKAWHPLAYRNAIPIRPPPTTRTTSKNWPKASSCKMLSVCGSCVAGRRKRNPLGLALRSIAIVVGIALCVLAAVAVLLLTAEHAEGRLAEIECACFRKCCHAAERSRLNGEITHCAPDRPTRSRKLERA